MNRREFLAAVTASPLAGLPTIGGTAEHPMVEHRFDVVVAGGGPAGIAAAITAARNGARVALIELKGSLGGTWTSGVLSCMIGFDRTDLDREITSRLRAMGATQPRRPGAVETYGANYLYEPEYLKIVLDDMVTEAGVEFRLHTMLVAVERRGRDIAAIITESKSGRERWIAKAFVDGTGDGDLGALAGCGYETGDGQGGPDQPASLLCTVAIDESEALRRFIANDSANYSEKGELRRNAKKELLKELKRLGVEPTYQAPTLNRIHPGLFLLMANHQYGVRVDDSAGITRATVQARKELFTLTDTLARKGGAEWKSMRLVHIAEQIGHRCARRIHGRYRLTAADVAAGRTFDDAVATSRFGIDIHGTTFAANVQLPAGTPGGVKFHPFQIPLRACQAADVDNLYMGGRCISGDFIPQASYRVTGTAIATGMAAGKAAAQAMETTSVRGGQAGCKGS